MLNSFNNNLPRPILAAGFGNIFMADDGIGCRLINHLQRQKDCYPKADLVDLSSNGLALVHKLEGREKLIVVDCAEMGELPGRMLRFNQAQVRSRKRGMRFSLHQLDLMQIMNLASFLGRLPKEVVVFGIQPCRVAPGDEISTVLSESFEKYAEEIAAEICKG